jgi:tetrahedral aminopeptidase
VETTELAFLKTLLETGSPSGYEGEIQRKIRDHVEPFANRIDRDWHGNLYATCNPEGSPRIMLAGHCDQIGLQVKFIEPEGFVRVGTIGGWDMQMLLGQKLQIWTSTGPVVGVIARKAIHLLTPDERKLIPEVHDLWIDIGARDREQAASKVAIGDPVTLYLGFEPLLNNLACAPGMDDKVGVWVVMSALKRVSQATGQASVVAVSTVQEEIGLRGATTSAYTVQADLGIAVDVTHATDCPGINQSQYGEVAIGKGPVIVRGPNANPKMFERLTEIARAEQIPFQVSALAKAASNDAAALQLSRGGQATAVVAIPNRYMHSPVEVISLDDLEHAAELIARFSLTLTPECDFTP